MNDNRDEIQRLRAMRAEAINRGDFGRADAIGADLARLESAAGGTIDPITGMPAASASVPSAPQGAPFQQRRDERKHFRCRENRTAELAEANQVRDGKKHHDEGVERGEVNQVAGQRGDGLPRYHQQRQAANRHIQRQQRPRDAPIAAGFVAWQGVRRQLPPAVVRERQVGADDGEHQRVDTQRQQPHRPALQRSQQVISRVKVVEHHHQLQIHARAEDSVLLVLHRQRAAQQQPQRTAEALAARIFFGRSR